MSVRLLSVLAGHGLPGIHLAEISGLQVGLAKIGLAKSGLTPARLTALALALLALGCQGKPAVAEPPAVVLAGGPAAAAPPAPVPSAAPSADAPLQPAPLLQVPAVALPAAPTQVLADHTPANHAAPAQARFVAFGDSGTGTPAQMRVASQIGATCKRAGCQFGLHLGDIFYTIGPKSTEDPRYIDWWERPYGRIGLPFYLSLGNHDYYGKPDASVAWTWRSPSKRWILPSRYYTFFRDGVRFLVLDTNQPTPEQAAFFRQVLEQARQAGEQWLVAYGHHPRFSVGQHADADPELAAWWDSLLCGRVDLYLAGHDHDKQVLKPHCGVQLAVSGAASMLRPVEASPKALFATSTLGFAVISLMGSEGQLQLFDDSGKSEYDHRWQKASRPACLGEPRCDGRCDSDPTCRPAR